MSDMTPEEQEAQRRSFAYGNTAIGNPAITRGLVDKAATRTFSERLAELEAKHRSFLDGKITDQELMTDVLLTWPNLLAMVKLAKEMRDRLRCCCICPTHGPGCGGGELTCQPPKNPCSDCKLIARYDALENRNGIA